ncbi:TatD DNase family protein [Nematocida major]|uniref:TatD DNase family protein n=1 Tax=Nematocida major TaxID=1912982 RepID=UPI0020082683|nr:TatD DNase family protein [Nematocida major]KAH9386873.1 TatD DNase family protein [Nematocida major]
MPYDIAVNITDPQYQGEYGQKKKHACDIPAVIERGKRAGVRMVFLGISVKSSAESVALANEYGEYCTVGIHPGSTKGAQDADVRSLVDILANQSIQSLRSLVGESILGLVAEKSLFSINSVIGIGEVGLDYHRDYSPREKQREIFSKILKETAIYKLPYVFHYRDCEEDFFDIVGQHSVEGVVHSYTGSIEEMRRLVRCGYYIGVNGASIRENEDTRVIEEIPLHRLLIETDAPWCSIRKTSAYYSCVGKYRTPSKKWSEHEGVKGRNEPANLLEVIDVVSHIKGIPKEQLIEATDRNFKALFRID